MLSLPERPDSIAKLKIKREMTTHVGEVPDGRFLLLFDLRSEPLLHSTRAPYTRRTRQGDDMVAGLKDSKEVEEEDDT